MTAPRLSDNVSEAVRKANPRLFGPRHEGSEMTVGRITQLTNYDPMLPTPRKASESGPGDEAEMMTDFEKWMRGRGYRNMSANGFNAALSEAQLPGRNRTAGFYAHWPHCEGNPLISDWLIIAYPVKSRCPLLLEFKARDKWQPGQKAAVTLKLWALAWSVEEWKRIVEEWEGG